MLLEPVHKLTTLKGAEHPHGMTHRVGIRHLGQHPSMLTVLLLAARRDDELIPPDLLLPQLAIGRLDRVSVASQERLGRWSPGAAPAPA
ncbi:hypothetical protein GCM10020000_87430 [Streptomyces olivoverticillatus]